MTSPSKKDIGTGPSSVTQQPIDLLRTREADMLTDWLVNLEKRPARASVDRFPAYQESLLDQDIVVVSDRFMPQLRECVRNRFTLQETDVHLRQLGYRGSFGAVRYRSHDARRENLPEPRVF